jgi:UDP-2-acetamido-2,6-beta-L-arabino-hexul-4-ose reductase
MVIGNGMIAKKFYEYQSDNKVIIFASGVSNSKETNDDLFLKERLLIEQTIQEISNNTLLVYFSTYSIHDKSLNESKYVKHKLNIEEIIKINSKNYLILRISNIVGKTQNPHTITNYLYNNIIHKKRFNVWINAYRNLIDIDDILIVSRYLIEYKKFHNNTYNIINDKNYTVIEIIKILEIITNKKAEYNLVQKGANFDVQVENEIYKNINLYFSDSYLESLLRKYYA